MAIINIKQTLDFAKDVDYICSPLKKVGITYFSYARVYKNGQRIDLNNHPEMSKWYYGDESLYTQSSIESDPSSLTGKMFSWAPFDNDPLFITARENFNTAHGITLCDYEKDYTELWNFASTKENRDIINFYFNNLNVLYQFQFYFREHAKNIINLFVSTIRSMVITTNTPYELKANINLDYKHSKTDVDNLFNISRYWLSIDEDSSYLTKREIECLQWFLEGKTAAEIAIILQIGTRGVEFHIENIKRKLDCYKQSKLATKIINLKLDSIQNFKNIKVSVLGRRSRS